MGLGSEAISFLLFHLAFPSGWMSWSTLWCAFLVIWVTKLEKCSFPYTYFQSQRSGNWRNGSAVKDACHDSRRTGLEFSRNPHKRGGERGSIPIIPVSKCGNWGSIPRAGWLSRLAPGLIERPCSSTCVKTHEKACTYIPSAHQNEQHTCMDSGERQQGLCAWRCNPR